MLNNQARLDEWSIKQRTIEVLFGAQLELLQKCYLSIDFFKKKHQRQFHQIISIASRCSWKRKLQIGDSAFEDHKLILTFHHNKKNQNFCSPSNKHLFLIREVILEAWLTMHEVIISRDCGIPNLQNLQEERIPNP